MNDEIQNPVFTYTINSDDLKALGHRLVVVYAILQALSSKYGYCFISDEKLAEQAGMGVKGIVKILKNLQDVGYIYRNTYSKNFGSKRHIITKSNAVNYWNRVLQKPSIPPQVRKEFIAFFMPTSAPNKLKKSLVMPQTEHSSWVPQMEHSLLRENLEVKTTTTKILISQPQKSEPKSVKSKLEEAGIFGKKLDMGLRYYNDHPDLFSKKSSPVGYLINGIKAGWILAHYQDEIIAKESSDKLLKSFAVGKKTCEEFFKEFKSSRAFKLSLGTHCMNISLGKGAFTIAFAEPDMTKLLTKLRGKHDIYYSRKTDSVEKSGKEGKHVF